MPGHRHRATYADFLARTYYEEIRCRLVQGLMIEERRGCAPPEPRQMLRIAGFARLDRLYVNVLRSEGSFAQARQFQRDAKRAIRAARDDYYR